MIFTAPAVTAADELGRIEQRRKELRFYLHRLVDTAADPYRYP